MLFFFFPRKLLMYGTVINRPNGNISTSSAGVTIPKMDLMLVSLKNLIRITWVWTLYCLTVTWLNQESLAEYKYTINVMAKSNGFLFQNFLTVLSKNIRTIYLSLWIFLLPWLTLFTPSLTLIGLLSFSIDHYVFFLYS